LGLGLIKITFQSRFIWVPNDVSLITWAVLLRLRSFEFSLRSQFVLGFLVSAQKPLVGWKVSLDVGVLSNCPSG
jgi:hypothetical protein